MNVDTRSIRSSGPKAAHRPPPAPVVEPAARHARVRDGFEAASAARVNGARFDPSSAASVEALAKQFAPVRYLHPEEKYGPADPLAFIKNARVREHRSFWPDRTVGGMDRGQIDPAKLKDLKGDKYFMDLSDSEQARAGTPNAPSFYQYDPKTRTMTYWYFYNYNDAPGPGRFDHEGDWERVTVQFDASMNPTHVRYSAHDGNTTLAWADAPKEDGRPVVYVAKGSHANSPFPGKGKTGVPFVFDEFKKGERVDDRARPMANIKDQPWYDTQVRWGERGLLAAVGQTFTSGPKGPGTGKGPLL